MARIWRRANHKYVVYRSAVHFLSVLAGALGKSIEATAKRYGIKVLRLRNFERELERLQAAGLFKVGVAFNLDQLVKRAVMDLFPLGVVNVHASRLPADAGISPALWAYARGDSAIWVSVYLMDTGIDTGPILDQFEVPVAGSGSAFAAYESVCSAAGERLPGILDRYLRGDLTPRPQVRDGTEPYCGWPDNRFAELLKGSGGKLLTAQDIWRVFRENTVVCGFRFP